MNENEANSKCDAKSEDSSLRSQSSSQTDDKSDACSVDSSICDQSSRKSDFLALQQKCRSLAADVQIHDYGGEIPTQASIIQADLNDLEKIKREFLDASLTLLTLAPDTAPNKVKEIAEDRMKFLKNVKSIRNQLLSGLPENLKSTSVAVNSAQSSGADTTKQPMIDLPQFSGLFNDWPEYKMTFESLVLNRPGLDDFSKLSYLRASFTAIALAHIRKLPLEPTHFATTWQILNEYFDDQFNEVNLYLNEIRQARNVTSWTQSHEKRTAFRDLILTFRQYAYGLETVFKTRPEIDPCSEILIHWFLQKCDRSISAEWNREIRRQNQPPDLDKFFKFIDTHYAANEPTASVTFQERSKSPESQKNKYKANSATTTISTQEVHLNSTSNLRKKCRYCSSFGHYITTCVRFSFLPSSERIKFCNEKKLCDYCLRWECKPSTCFRRLCSICKQGHHDLLHHDEGIGSNLESDKSSDFGDLNLPSKSSYKSVKSDYMDINTPKKVFSAVKSEYTDINYPAKSSRHPVSAQHQYADSGENARETPSYDEPGYPSPESDIFKEAFRLISQHGNGDEAVKHESPFALPQPKSPSRHEGYEKVKSLPAHLSIPSADDGYGNAEFERPGDSSPHYRPNLDHQPPRRDHQRKAYVAPVFDVPHSGEVTFNQHRAPVKYALHPKTASLSTYGQQVTHDYPVDSVQYSGETGGQDHEEYSAHYKKDYHHKPEKTKYEKGGGESFKEHHFSKHGEKGDKGFKKYNDFDEGEMGHHGKEGKKGYHDNESGHKKEHHTDGKKFGEVHGQLHGEKGVKYGEAEGHKKGHKTSGYHNVFHKDEFKKEHKFYDDAHKHGYKDKQGGYHTDHGKKHNHESSGGFHDAAFDHGHKGDSGTYKKGHFDQDHKGHKGASGHESHYNHHEDYGKKGGHSDKKKYDFEHGH